MKQELKRRPLGTTGEHITEVSLGAMNLRTLDTEVEGIAVINKALDLGINLIDTARGYSEEKPDGSLRESEVLVKKALTEYKGLTEPIVIVTKGHGYDIEAFDRDLKTSREKLGIEGQTKLTIGGTAIKLVYFFHGISQDRWVSMKENGVLDHAKTLQEQGLFTYLGFSSHNGHEECIDDAIKSDYFQVIELPYNVFAPGLEDLIKLAYDKGIGVINMKAFGGNGMVSKTEVFKQYCDISTQKRLQFALASPYITTVDAGCKFIEEINEDVATAMLPKLSKVECDQLIGLAKRVGECTEGTCRECTHCLEKFECPQDVNFPKILALHTRYKIANEFDYEIETIKKKYVAIREEALKCVSCGLCKEWCEYKLDIPKLLQETQYLLK